MNSCFLSEQQHLVLIGFKASGKSTLARLIADALGRPLVDLDRSIELYYQNQFQVSISCRELMEEKGEKYFRAVEHEVLVSVINREPSVIAVGGGTPLLPLNRSVLQGSLIVHVQASKLSVFERIQQQGRPSYFDKGKDLWLNFNHLWDEREPLYQAMADCVLVNEGPAENIVKNFLSSLKKNA